MHLFASRTGTGVPGDFIASSGRSTYRFRGGLRSSAAPPLGTTALDPTISPYDRIPK
jgi:hypothetical protein